MLSDHLFFITERIIDILELEEEREQKRNFGISALGLDEERKLECWDDEGIRKQRIRNSMQELHKVLSRVVVYLRDVEQRSDEHQHDHDPFYLELSDIAVSSDDILNCVFSNDVVVNDTYDGNDTASVINHLVNRIRNSHHLLPSGSTYNFNTVGNTNMSGQQIIGSTQIYIDPSHSKAPMINRISRPKTYGDYPDSDIVGFQREIQTILDYLTQDDETRVVGIVGMGGIGKTTLAKHIYHHPNIKTCFTYKVWVCISESWDKTTILRGICRQVIPEATIMDYDEAIRLLSKHLRSESYLVVLDDMWSIDAWYDISPAFLPWSSGSKFVVTSRNIGVPQRFDHTVHIVEPKPLHDKESWELFQKKAFLPENISDMLLQQGKEMVKQCKGLPLAIVALAGVLRIGTTKSNWERVSKRLTHNILKEKNQSTQGIVQDVLALSYRELPHHLKQCVLYLRLFPEDYMINAKNLMKMWIVEGLISTNEESTAEEYLDEIAQRYIVQVVKTNFTGQVKRIQIHDLIRQMFVDIDKERGLLRDSLRLASSTTIYGDEKNGDFSSKLQSQRIANVERFSLREPSSHIRSVIFLNHSNLFGSVLQSMFVKFRLLRVLFLHEISNISGIEIPEEIGNLIHLRYFELGGGVEQLPWSIGNLKNLWILNMRNIKLERQAWIKLSKLKELKHLYLPSDSLGSIDMEYLKLETLRKLKTLWNVRGGEWMVLEMTRLSSVLEELRVIRISSGKELCEVFTTPSIMSNNLHTLELDWYGFDNSIVKLVGMDMLMLSKCKSIKKLKLCGQVDTSTKIMFPPNLFKLEMRLTYLQNGEVMNIISESCPNLEILKFGLSSFQGKELVCKANTFRKLVKLTLEDLANLKKWIIESTAMLSLHYLTIRRCKHLDLDLNPESRRRISNIPHLTYE